MRDKKDNVRIAIVIFFFGFLFLAIGARIVYLQFFRQSYLRKLALAQHQKSVRIQGERGRILDRQGRVLALDLTVYSMYADPALITNKEYLVGRLKKYCKISAVELYERLCKKTRFVWINRNLSPAVKKEIESLNLAGIFFIKEKKRFYPQGMLLSHVLGGVNIDNEGIEGVEFYYDDQLRGKEGKSLVVTDSTSSSLFFHPQIINPSRGLDLMLTIDAQVQYWTEEYLKETVDTYSAKGGSVVVMEPFNGEIIALANYNKYDPNKINLTERANLRNGAVADIFEPGSVFKVVTLIAALQERKYSLNDTIFCENGVYKIPGTTLHDYRPYGNLSFREVFTKSSNIGVAKIANSLGAETLFNYICKLGFGEKTGIDLPGETPGLVKQPHQWSNTSLSIIPIGQEIGVNTVQLARMMSVVVNGGYRVVPHVAKQFVGDYGYRRSFFFNRQRIMEQEVVKQVKEVLQLVVSEGTGKLAKIDDQGSVGGKTGTAQKYDVALGRYSPTAYRATFVGFVEAIDTSFVICVTIDEPQRSHFGGVVAAPLFRKISQAIIGYDLQETKFAVRR